MIAGARIDRASAKDFRARIGSGMMSKPNPTLDKTRADTAQRLRAMSTTSWLTGPTTVYAGVGHTQRFPDYWELFSPTSGPAGR